MSDPFDLERFVRAQEGTYAAALAELERGRKETHWIWFVFPQARGLGASPRSRHFALSGTEEARAYWEHPVLGARLRACMEALLLHPQRSAHEIFGSPDDLKVRSCATLFDAVTHEAVFADVLRRFYAGVPDDATLRVLRSAGRNA